MSSCGYPGCEWKGESRPYARKGTPSVTTIISMANLGEKARKFAWAAAELAAVKATHYFDWGNAPVEPCTEDHAVKPGLCRTCKLFRSEFDRVWSAKAALGNHCHHLAASWAEGAEVASDPVIDPYLDGLEAWYGTYKPAWQYLEQTVCYRRKRLAYVGTLDAIAEIDCPLHPGERCTWLLDIKTGEGQWYSEWTLQLSAYAYSDHLTTWVDGTEHKGISTPPVAHAGVIWMQPGEAQLLPVEINAEAHNQFLRLLDVLNWERRFEASRAKSDQDAA
jgi:hypothetical protein